MNLFDRDAPIYVAGHRGLVGSALWRHLSAQGCHDLIGRTSAELDLTDRSATFDFFADAKPKIVVLAAARVGGIMANDAHPVEFLSENLQIQVNVMDAALENDVDRLLFLGSSCIYPKDASQPMSEDSLLTGRLEPTNSSYAIAKIAGILHVQSVRREYGRSWISVMPTNLFGPGDNFSPVRSHVIPALIRRYDDAVRSGAEEVVNWGTGRPRREFMHVDELADACVHLLGHYDDPEQVNVGTGRDTTIRELAETVARVVGFDGRTTWDASKPDGMDQKLMDVSKLTQMGWKAQMGLEDGLASTVDWYRSHLGSLRG